MSTTELVRNAIAGRVRLARQCGVIHATVDYLGLIEQLTSAVMDAIDTSGDVAELRAQWQAGVAARTK